MRIPPNKNFNPNPKYRDFNIYSQFIFLRLPLFSLVAIIMFGTVGYMLIDDFELMDAIYQTCITFTTVGFGEVAPISDAGRLFTIFLIVLGFGVFSFSLGVIVDLFSRGKFFLFLREYKMFKKVLRLTNHYVLCYQNNYTIELSKQLRKNHIPFIVIDPDESIKDLALKYQYPYYLQANPNSELAFERANISSASSVITFAKNISENIAQISLTRLYEKEIGREKYPYYIATCAIDTEDIEKLKKIGANTVISPTQITAQRISAVSLRPDMNSMMEEFLTDNSTSIDIEEIVVPARSWLRFKKIPTDIFKNMTNVNIIGVKYQDKKLIPMPQGDVLIATNTRLLIIGTMDSIKETKILVARRDSPQGFNNEN